jgi:hypothetical protein
MTPANMAKHRNNPNIPFWKMIKEGYDHFEATRHEPKVDVCERRYVFNAAPPANSSTPLNFSPRGPCPVYQLPEDMVASVTDKKRRDEIETAELINRGTPTAPIKLPTDGGMHPIFVAALQGGQPVLDADGGIRALIPVTAPGKIPPNVTPPPVLALASTEAEVGPTPRAASRQPVRAPTRTASTEPAAAPSNDADKAQKSSPSILSRVSNMLGLRGSDTTPAQAEQASAKPAVKPTPALAVAARPKPQPQPISEPAAAPTKTASAGGIWPQSKPAENKPSTGKPAAASASMLSGAAPVVPTGSFDNGWSTLR